MVDQAAPTDERRSPLERLLSVIAPVRGGEGLTAFMLTLNVTFLMTAYYLIKPVREGLFLASPGGAELKSYTGAGSALLLMVIVPYYGKLVDLMPRNRLIGTVTAIFVFCMLGFYGASQSPTLLPHLAIPFYLWLSVFSMMVIAQFWAFANDLYDDEQGKRLFAILGLGASTGSVVGAKLNEWLLTPPDFLPLPRLSVFELLLVSAALLAATMGMTQWVHLREGASRKARASKERPKGAYALVMANR